MLCSYEIANESYHISTAENEFEDMQSCETFVEETVVAKAVSPRVLILLKTCSRA